jgi:hypothetical protein
MKTILIALLLMCSAKGQVITHYVPQPSYGYQFKPYRVKDTGHLTVVEHKKLVRYIDSIRRPTIKELYLCRKGDSSYWVCPDTTLIKLFHKK